VIVVTQLELLYILNEMQMIMYFLQNEMIFVCWYCCWIKFNTPSIQIHNTNTTQEDSFWGYLWPIKMLISKKVGGREQINSLNFLFSFGYETNHLKEYLVKKEKGERYNLQSFSLCSLWINSLRSLHLLLLAYAYCTSVCSCLRLDVFI